MTTIGTTSDNEQSFRLNFLFCELGEEPTTKNYKENSLNLGKGLLNKEQKLAPKKKYRQ